MKSKKIDKIYLPKKLNKIPSLTKQHKTVRTNSKMEYMYEVF